MAETVHDGQFGPVDHRCGIARSLGRARMVVFSGQHEDRAFRGVDLAQALGHVPVHGVEVQVALEHAGTALHVVPERLPAVLYRRAWTDQSPAIGRTELATVDVRLVQAVQREIALHEGG